MLTEDPDDPDALAAGGWLEWNAGVTGKSAAVEQAGRQSEEKAVRVAPSFYGGHLYLGLILLDQDDNAPGAVKQFTAFLADGPPRPRSRASPRRSPPPGRRCTNRFRRRRSARRDDDYDARRRRRRQPRRARSPATTSAKAMPKAATSSSVVDQPTETRSE